MHLVLAVGFASAGDKEKARMFLGKSLREVLAGRGYLDSRWVGKYLALDPGGFSSVVDRTLAEVGETAGGEWPARFLADLAAELVRSGEKKKGEETWKRALALAGKENASLLEDLGETALRAGKKEWALPLLGPLFAEGRIEPGSAARVFSALRAGGVEKETLRRGLESYLPWCPRKDLALLAPGILPVSRAKAFLEKALAENPGDPQLQAALEKLRAHPVK